VILYLSQSAVNVHVAEVIYFLFLKGLKRYPQPKSLVYGEKCKVQCTLILSKGHNGRCEQESDTNDTESAARGCVWL